MIEINGSHGEGGGQILRTCLGLSAFTQTGFSIKNIRANRSNPGLSHQHLKCIEAVEQLTNANVKGKELRSKKLVFKPNGYLENSFSVDIGTAGSVTLLLQSILPALPKLNQEIEIEVIGGTDVKWSPPFDYFKEIALYLLNKIGLNCSIELKKRGYYPKGGGKIVFRYRPSSLVPFDLVERGDLREVRGVSFSSNLPAHVARRQSSSAQKELERNLSEEIDVSFSIKRDKGATGKGSGVVLWLVFENSRIGASSLGEPGKPAEEVGEEAVENLIRQFRKEGCVDKHMGDQLIPFLGIVGESRVKVTEVSSHTKTNVWVVSKFLNKEIEIKEKGCIIS